MTSFKDFGKGCRNQVSCARLKGRIDSFAEASPNYRIFCHWLKNYAKWHKIKCTYLIVPENRTGMMLIINVEVILRYANDTLTFSATYHKKGTSMSSKLVLVLNCGSSSLKFAILDAVNGDEYPVRFSGNASTCQKPRIKMEN